MIATLAIGLASTAMNMYNQSEQEKANKKAFNDQKKLLEQKRRNETAQYTGQIVTSGTQANQANNASLMYNGRNKTVLAGLAGVYGSSMANKEQGRVGMAQSEVAYQEGLANARVGYQRSQDANQSTLGADLLNTAISGYGAYEADQAKKDEQELMKKLLE